VEWREENGAVRIETKRKCMIRIVIRKNEMNRKIKKRREEKKEERKNRRKEKRKTRRERVHQ
jgi:hypothetical protein